MLFNTFTVFEDCGLGKLWRSFLPMILVQVFHLGVRIHFLATELLYPNHLTNVKPLQSSQPTISFTLSKHLLFEEKAVFSSSGIPLVS